MLTDSVSQEFNQGRGDFIISALKWLQTYMGRLKDWRRPNGWGLELSRASPPTYLAINGSCWQGAQLSCSLESCEGPLQLSSPSGPVGLLCFRVVAFQERVRKELYYLLWFNFKIHITLLEFVHTDQGDRVYRPKCSMEGLSNSHYRESM